MDLDQVFSKRYHLQQSLHSEQIGAIALTIYLAENLEIPVMPKPLCVIYYWQDVKREEQDLENLEHTFDDQAQAIAKGIAELAISYTLAPKVQAFFYEENYYCLVREYLQGYDYLTEFQQQAHKCLDKLNLNPLSSKDTEAKDLDIPELKKSTISTLKALPLLQSLAQSVAKIPFSINHLNRRQLLNNTGYTIAGFTLAVLIEKLKPQTSAPPLTIAEPATVPIPEVAVDPITKGDRAFRDDLGKGIYLEMVRIPSGKFTIGSPVSQLGRKENESPLVEVQMPNFYMAKFAITQEQWIAIMGSNPATFRENIQAPVENISWTEAQDFCGQLAQRSPYLYSYRLPSEAEWEYACRAGTNTAYHFGDNPAELVDYGWFAGNANQRSQPVGQKVPNPWGLYDMQGGVWEWCADTWHDNFNGVPADGSVWVDQSGWNASRRVRKGGSWSNEAQRCRAASRDWHWQSDRYNDIGFRVVISAIPLAPKN